MDEITDSLMTLGVGILAVSLIILLLSAFPTASRILGVSAETTRNIGFFILTLAVFVLWWRGSGPGELSR